MSELTLIILRLAFLALLWVFVFAIVYALRSDLFGPHTRRAAETPPPAAPYPSAPLPPPAAAASAMPPAQATVTERLAAQRAVPNVPSPGLPRRDGGGHGRARRLVITGGPRAGLEIDLPDDQLTIGRSSDSDLVIRDDYTSTHHARLMVWNDEWVVQDLDSTNGTYVQGTRVTTPTPVPPGVPVRIGTTTFELRR